MSKKIQDHYKYNRLISALRQKIFAGEFDHEGQLPPERKLAEMFGFARVTIRTALRELKEDGLVEQRPGVGTFVKLPQKQQPEPQRREYRFCFICRPSPMNLTPEADPYNSQLLLGFFKAKNRENMFTLDTLVIPHDFDSLADYAGKTGTDFDQWDGLILSHGPTDADIDWLVRGKRNFVVQGEIESMRYFPVVTVDNFTGAYLLTRHLLAKGKKEPLFLFVEEKHLWEKRRIAGFLQALSDAGIPNGRERIVHEIPADVGETRSYMKELIRRKVPFDALIIAGDIHGIGVLEELKNSGIRVPEDVAIGIYGGFRWFSNMFPHVPCLTQPFADIGETAIGMLKEQLANQQCPISIKVISPKLVADNI